MAGWSDYYPIWDASSLRGQLYYPALIALSEAVNERCRVVSISEISTQILGRTVGNVLGSIISKLSTLVESGTVIRYVDQTKEVGGSFHGQGSIPKWTKASIMADINPSFTSADWPISGRGETPVENILKCYEIINRLVWVSYSRNIANSTPLTRGFGGFRIFAGGYPTYAELAAVWPYAWSTTTSRLAISSFCFSVNGGTFTASRYSPIFLVDLPESYTHRYSLYLKLYNGGHAFWTESGKYVENSINLFKSDSTSSQSYSFDLRTKIGTSLPDNPGVDNWIEWDTVNISDPQSRQLVVEYDVSGGFVFVA
jgi:hypothetical protein